MKKLLIFAVLFICCVTTTFAQFTGSGSGTENDPYLITNPINLNQLRNFLNTEGVYFKMMANIDLTDYLENENPTQGWQPVGSSSSTAFKGNIDGNGKVIKGLYINRSSSDNVGFLGYTSGAVIKNLVLKDVEVVGNDYVGAIIGNGSATINNIVIDGTVDGNSYVGGICGSGGGEYNNIVSYVVVNGKKNYIGGLVGYTSSTIFNCQVSSNNIKGLEYVGGVAGAVYLASISKSSFIGNLSGNTNVGGLTGDSSGRIEYCYSLGNIEALGDNVGGLVGSHHSESGLEYSYFYGNVSGKNYVGGLIGNLVGVVNNCYSRATIKGSDIVGGIVGYMGIAYMRWSVVTSCVASNTSITALNEKVGRIYGSIKGDSRVGEMGSSNENKSLNRTIVIRAGVSQDNMTDNEQNGTSVGPISLNLKATYVSMGWDFNNTWAIQETECYPYFKNQTAPPMITSNIVSGATNITGKCVDGGIVTLEIDGVKQQIISSNNTFSFTVSPLQAGHEVRISAKTDGKEQSYYTTETVQYLGKGTESEPYQVYTASDLTGVYRKGYFKLMNDIDLTDYISQFSPTEGWQSIGRDGSETIHFDGNGKKITGLWCNSTRDNMGLFSCLANGTIKNLTVEVASGKQVKGGANTGILIGKMINGTIENCKVSGTVADGTPVGGMVGLFDGGSISRCQASITIATTGATSYVGGLVGETTGGTIDQCVTTGTLAATGTESYVGGLVGKNYATITNSYSTSNITSSYNAAGIVAYNYSLVDKCLYTGDLYSNNYAAGIIGYNDGENAVVQNCMATSNKIEVVYESQQLQQGGGYGQRIIGGIKNNAPAPEMNNYALKTMQVSLNDVPQVVYDDLMNGVAKTEIELKSAATYQTLGWDFENIWHIDEGKSYPYQEIKVNSGTEPVNPNNPDAPNNPVDPQTIVEVSDISTMNNIIYIEPMEELCGTQATISLKMKNSAEIRGFQFDLYLPEGVTVVKSSKGKIQGFLSEGRLPDEDEHTLTFSEQSDGAIRFLCSSQYEETFTGNDGEIATLKVNISENMEDGEYPIQLKSMKLTENNISNFYETTLIQSKLTISTYVLGDINGDGVVDVSDYTGVANHIHDNTPDGFNAKAADVDENGAIDVSDYTGIANIIHTGSIYGNSSNARPMRLSPRRLIPI